MRTSRTLSAVCLAAWLAAPLAGAEPLSGSGLQIHEPVILPVGGARIVSASGSLWIEGSLVTTLSGNPVQSQNSSLQLEGALLATGEPPARTVVPALPTAAFTALAALLLGGAFQLGRASNSRQGVTA